MITIKGLQRNVAPIMPEDIKSVMSDIISKKDLSQNVSNYVGAYVKIIVWAMCLGDIMIKVQTKNDDIKQFDMKDVEMEVSPFGAMWNINDYFRSKDGFVVLDSLEKDPSSLESECEYDRIPIYHIAVNVRSLIDGSLKVTGYVDPNTSATFYTIKDACNDPQDYKPDYEKDCLSKIMRLGSIPSTATIEESEMTKIKNAILKDYGKNVLDSFDSRNSV